MFYLFYVSYRLHRRLFILNLVSSGRSEFESLKILENLEARSSNKVRLLCHKDDLRMQIEDAASHLGAHRTGPPFKQW